MVPIGGDRPIAGIFAAAGSALGAPGTLQQLQAVKNMCPGRIASAQLVDKPRDTKKRGKAGTAAAGTAGISRPHSAQQAQQQLAPRRPAGAGVSMSLTKAEEFLGIKHEGKRADGFGLLIHRRCLGAS